MILFISQEISLVVMSYPFIHYCFLCFTNNLLITCNLETYDAHFSLRHYT